MAASVSRQENHFAPGNFSGEQIVRWRAEWRFDFHPFLVGEAFDVVKSRAADDSDSIFRHKFFYSIGGGRVTAFSRLTLAHGSVRLRTWNYFNAFSKRRSRAELPMSI